jgi:membrane associated rhomboid family serine protease
MGLADREYHRQPPPRGGGFLAHVSPVVKGLLMANVAIFFLDYVVLASMENDGGAYHGLPPLLRWGAFAVQSALFEFRIYEFVTFQFLHGSLGHVLFNCIGLYFFGPWMERWWGSRRFLWFYLLCGAAGAAFFTLLLALKVVPGDFQTPMVGASAGIYGIFIGVAVIAPSMRVQLLFPPIELSMRQLAIGLLVISIGAILLSIGGNEGGEAGHLGGAILGFILMRRPEWLGGRDGVEIIRPPAFRRPHEAKLRPRSQHHKEVDSAVDAILDKISREGFQSLTDAEREILREAAERKKHDP